MSSSGARRALVFDTPARPNKRARTTKPRRRTGPMRVPKSLLPEMKQHRRNNLTDASTNTAGHSIPLDITQGDGGNEFVGSKFRAKRLRVNYDFTDANPATLGFRILVYIPKRPSESTTSIPSSTVGQIDTHEYTVLFDRLVPNDASMKIGTFDVPMNILVELDATGTSVYRNDLRIGAFAVGLGTTVRDDISYSLWYTDA